MAKEPLYDEAGSVVVIVLLLILNSLLVAVYAIYSNERKTPQPEKQHAEARMHRVLQDAKCIPPELFGPRVAYAPMTQTARDTVQAKYNQQLLGVPEVGQAFQLSLDPVPPDEVLAAIIESLAHEAAEPGLVVVRFREPNALVAYTAKLEAANGIPFCEPGAPCAGIDMWVARDVSLPSGFCTPPKEA